jgi:hypothetical protein
LKVRALEQPFANTVIEPATMAMLMTQRLFIEDSL